MWANPQKAADMFTFTKEILHGNLRDFLQCNFFEISPHLQRILKLIEWFLIYRCVPDNNQMKILLPMPPAQSNKAFLYDFEGYVEAILEGRRGGRTLKNMTGMLKRWMLCLFMLTTFCQDIWNMKIIWKFKDFYGRLCYFIH